jgi:signal transduction histidine kinase
LKYSDPQRPPIIRISGHTKGDQSVYCIEDNGIGIDPGHQKNVFEIFHRLDPDKCEGEGLGLTIVQQVLGRLSGDIWVESEKEKGSRFFVSLPKNLK